MRRAMTLAMLLVTMFFVAACGGNETQRSEQGVQPKEEQAAPATQGSATSEGASQESAQGGGNSEATSKAAGLSVTTLQGEQVSLGDQGEVTALYFMAGW